MNIIIFLIILLVLVLVHEFGHFLTAKKFGIRVDEFGFGFPPKLFGKKYGETEYTLNLLPFGGFVKIFGEDVDEADFVEVGFLDKEETSEKIESAKRSLANKPKYQQALVLFAGVFANFLLAWLLFSVGFMSGFPTSVGSEPAGSKLANVNLTVVSVAEKSPAQDAGLSTGDKIVSVKYMNSEKAAETIADINTNTFKSFILSHLNKKIEIGYIRGGNKNINYTNVTPVTNVADGNPMIGITMDQIGVAKLPFFGAFYEGMKLNWVMVKGTAVGLYGLIKDGLTGHGSFASVTGPVGMVGIVGDAYKLGFAYLLSFAGLISINLSIINILPLPALDGGRLLFLLIEKIKGSRISPKIVNTANMVGFGALILLMLVITYHDIVKLF